jgi:hypothetical protein
LFHALYNGPGGIMRIEDQSGLGCRSLKGKCELRHCKLVSVNNIESSVSPQLLNLPAHTPQIISLNEKRALAQLAPQPVIAI